MPRSWLPRLAVVWGLAVAAWPGASVGVQESGPQATMPASPTSDPAGAVLYQADPSGGFAEWPLPPGGAWSLADGMLRSAPAAAGVGERVYAPRGATTGNFALEAEIQLSGAGAWAGRYGLVFWATPDGGFCGADLDVAAGEARIHLFGEPLGTRWGEALGGAPHDWHTYRLELRGETARLVVDGRPLVEVSEPRLIPQPGAVGRGQAVGLLSAGPTLSVRRFTVYAL